ncbi:hypothetical protein ACGFWE_12130 [Streptomyces sp. NPDC048523]|uniref:hypothetical protein n=1 Tax=Streptomyces sp. NPDC048523 TaxID=3365567 RepID=UPI0037134B25
MTWLDKTDAAVVGFVVRRVTDGPVEQDLGCRAGSPAAATAIRARGAASCEKLMTCTEIWLPKCHLVTTG